jgi:RNA polymerase sigma-70 factor (ECF subfamily)
MLFRIPLRKPRSKSEEDLIKEFRISGDLELLGELYSGYMHLVYGVSLKYFRDREESMDAVMQIFEKLIIEIPRHDIENFRNWLFSVTRNYCLMELRTRKSHNERLNEWINETGSFVENGQELHPIDNYGNDMDKALEDCIERLKDEQRICIRQFYFDNKCYNEIAINLDVDEKKVKSYLQNGKRNLKLCLEEKNERER